MSKKTVKIIAIVIASVFTLTICASLIGTIIYGLMG